MFQASNAINDALLFSPSYTAGASSFKKFVNLIVVFTLRTLPSTSEVEARWERNESLKVSRQLGKPLLLSKLATGYQ